MNQERFRGSKWYIADAKPPGIYPNCGRFTEIFANDPNVPPASHELQVPRWDFIDGSDGRKHPVFVGWQMTVHNREGRILTGDTGTGGLKIAAWRSNSMFPEKTGRVIRHSYVDQNGNSSYVEVSDGSDGDRNI